MRLTIIGDSISQGLGRKHYNYCNELKCFFEQETKQSLDITNMAITGKTILYANEITDKIKDTNPDVILIFLGSVDAMVRPQKRLLWNILPNRYKKNGMLDPRPFYSSKIYKKIPQKIDSWIRLHLKLILLKINGTYSWVTKDRFKKEYEIFLKKFVNTNIIMVSPVYVDEKYFPKSNENLLSYLEVVKELAFKYKKSFLDVYHLQMQKNWNEIYNSDHFHPNESGYTWLAEIISKKLIDDFSDKNQGKLK